MGRFVMFIALAASLLVACSSSSSSPPPSAPASLVGSCPVTGAYSTRYVLESGTCGPRGAIRTVQILAEAGKITVDMDADASHLPYFETTDFDVPTCTLSGTWTMPSILACASDVQGTIALAFAAEGIAGSEGVQNLECTRGDGGLTGCAGAYGIVGSRE